jgi:putative methionine-R-sulfoxide reductase with GAF domain
LVKELRESFSYYNAYVFLMDDEMNRAVVVDGTGQVGQALTATRFSVGRSEGIVGSAIENRQVFLANDLNQEPRHIPNPLLPNAQSELVVPIVAGDKVLGAIDVQKTTINAFSQVDVDVLRALASQVGTGLQNARQIISARKVAEREALISRITERIRETKDLDSAMRTATVELGRIVKADKVAVRLNRKTEPEREQELSNVENEGSD